MVTPTQKLFYKYIFCSKLSTDFVTVKKPLKFQRASVLCVCVCVFERERERERERGEEGEREGEQYVPVWDTCIDGRVILKCIVSK